MVKIKSLIDHYWLFTLLFLLALGSLVLPWRQTYTKRQVSILPSSVVVDQAIVIDQGVQVNWLEAQAGAHPIGGYIIERSRSSGSDFIFIARVEKISLEYLDTEGQAGDKYRIIAEDDQRPAGRSPASEQLVAAPAKPGSIVVLAPAAQVLGTSTALDQASTPNTKAVALRDRMTQAFAGFDAALAGGNTTSARSVLHAIQDYQRQVLSLFPWLSSAEKISLARTCAEQSGIFEINLHVLAEDDQLDGMMVLAGCDAIQDGAK